MHRTTLMLALIAAGALIAVACDRGDKPPTSIGGNPSAVLDDETATDTETAADTAADEVGPADDTPALESETILDDEGDPSPPLLAVTWTDGAAASESSSVSFGVTNTGTVAISYSVSLYATSHVGNAERPVGEATLAPLESASYSVPANELPVRSSAVVGTLSVRVRWIESMPGGPREVVEDLAPRYVLHAAGYGAVRAFDEASLRSERNGAIVSLPIPASDAVESAADESVGDVWNGEGYAGTTMGESGLFLRDEGGNVYGVINEMRFGAEMLTDLPDAPVDEADAVETEVTDE